MVLLMPVQVHICDYRLELLEGLGLGVLEHVAFYLAGQQES